MDKQYSSYKLLRLLLNEFAIDNGWLCFFMLLLSNSCLFQSTTKSPSDSNGESEIMSVSVVEWLFSVLDECNLERSSFSKRQLSTCLSITIKLCLFTDCHSTSNGGAFYASTKGGIEIEKTIFCFCSSTKQGGALSCKIAELLMKDVCFFDCFSLYNNDDVFHAAKIFGAVSKSSIDISYSAIALCSRNIASYDVGICIFYNCVSKLKYNNFTKNMERSGTIAFYSSSVLTVQWSFSILKTARLGALLNWLQVLQSRKPIFWVITKAQLTST